MIIVTDLLIIDHLIHVSLTLPLFTLNIQTPQLRTILNLKFEKSTTYYPMVCLK